MVDPFAGLPDPFADTPPPPRAAPPPPAAPAAKLPDPFADLGAPSAERLPDPFADMGAPTAESLPEPFAQTVMPSAAMQPAATMVTPAPNIPAPAPVALPIANPFAEAGIPAPPAVTPQPVTGDGLLAALALIHQAAGLGPPSPGTDAAAALAAVGAGMRAAVSGMRGLLIARADVKREFRIEQTMLRAAGNNPVKFAATDEAALLALLGPKGNGAAALKETVQDLTAHQVATIAATQAAAKALLARLAPGPLEAEIPSGGIMPGAREKKLWEAYRKLHQQVNDQFEDDFDSAFGKAFARAYEEAARGGR